MEFFRHKKPDVPADVTRTLVLQGLKANAWFPQSFLTSSCMFAYQLTNLALEGRLEPNIMRADVLNNITPSLVENMQQAARRFHQGVGNFTTRAETTNSPAPKLTAIWERYVLGGTRLVNIMAASVEGRTESNAARYFNNGHHREQLVAIRDTLAFVVNTMQSDETLLQIQEQYVAEITAFMHEEPNLDDPQYLQAIQTLHQNMLRRMHDYYFRLRLVGAAWIREHPDLANTLRATADPVGWFDRAFKNEASIVYVNPRQVAIPH